MEDVLRWLGPRQRAVLIGQAAGVSNTKLARRMGTDYGTVKRLERQGLRRIRRRLAAKGLKGAK